MEPRRNNAPHASSPASSIAGGGGSVLNTVLVVLLIITSILATVYLGVRLLSSTSNAGAVKGSQYQALFLTNGQVYFGHLKSVDSSYVKLSDIYYLQVQQSVQPSDQKSSSQQPNVSLAKLGSELHGPEDVMYVSRDQVLFWENLKGDGKVTQAIKDYQSGNKK
jgi:hypothetical protein